MPAREREPTDAEARELIQLAYSVFTEGEPERLEARLDPEVEFVNPEYAIEGGTRRGPASFMEAVRGLLDTFEYAAFDVSTLERSGNRALAVVDVETRGKDSGVELRDRFVHVFTFRGGNLLRFAWFRDVEEGRRALRAG